MNEEQKPEEEKRNLTDKDVEAVANATIGKIISGVLVILFLMYINRGWDKISGDFANSASQLSGIGAFFQHLFSN